MPFRIMACRVRMRRWARASRAWPKALALVPFALVVGAGDGICQGGEGGQEHGVFESLVAGAADALAADR